MVLGLLFALFSSVLYGLEPTLRKYALNSGVTSEDTVAIVFAVSLVLSVLFCLIRKQSLSIPKKDKISLFFMGFFCSGMTNLLLALSYKYIPVGFATVTHFIYPTLVCLISAIIFKENLSFSKISAIICSVAGLICIGSSSFSSSIKGILIAFCSSITFSSYILILGHSSAGKHPADKKMVYIICGSFTLGLLMSVTRQSHYFNMKAVSVLAVCGLMNFLAAILFVSAIAKIGSVSSSFMSVFEPVTSLIVSTCVYKYDLSLVSIIGCVLMITAILFISIGNISVKKNTPSA